MSEHRQTWLSLGSNLGDRAGLIGRAIAALRAHPEITVERVSGLYETPPWGDPDQGPFLNAAAAIRTTLSPHALLDAAQAIETALGRVRSRRWGPRTIDIDIVHVEGVALADDRLILPHPHWRDRAFVLVPLAEIALGLVIGGVSVGDATGRLAFQPGPTRPIFRSWPEPRKPMPPRRARRPVPARSRNPPSPN